jgi:hypothetical protein
VLAEVQVLDEDPEPTKRFDLPFNSKSSDNAQRWGVERKKKDVTRGVRTVSFPLRNSAL